MESLYALPLMVKAVILGIVEGLTEFLPISSTGHLILTSSLLGWDDEKASVFAIAIQTGAILAVIWYYRERIGKVLAGLTSDRVQQRFALNIIIAFIPAAVLGVLFVLGFSKPVLDAYIIIVGFQAVLIHSNVKLPWGWLRYIIVTPDFHHWHHSSDTEAIDKNYAAHFSFIDYLFGTAVRGAGNRLPQNYGILDNDMPGTFLAQQAYPFARRK